MQQRSANDSSESLNKELRRLSTIKDEIIKKLDNAQKKVVVTEGDVKRMRELEDEVDKRRLQTRNLGADLDNVQRQLEACDSTATKQITLLLRNLKESQDKYNETLAELQSARKELTSTKQKGPDVSNEINAKNDEIARLKAASAESLKVQRALETAQQGTKEQAVTVLEDLRKELNVKKSELEKLRRECASKTNESVNDCKQQKELIRSLKDSLNNLTGIINGLINNQITAKNTLSSINDALRAKL